MNRLEIDLKKLRENDIPITMATIPPEMSTWKPSPEIARAVSLIREYAELIYLCKNLELEEMVIAYDYVQKLIESRPKWAKKPGEVTETSTETRVNAGKV